MEKSTLYQSEPLPNNIATQWFWEYQPTPFHLFSQFHFLMMIQYFNTDCIVNDCYAELSEGQCDKFIYVFTKYLLRTHYRPGMHQRKKCISIITVFCSTILFFSEWVTGEIIMHIMSQQIH